MKILTILILFFSTKALTSEQCKTDDQAESECCEMSKGTGLTRADRMWSVSGKTCLLTIHPTKPSNANHDFIYNSEGQFFIFTRPGSSKSYLIFPFGDRPLATVDKAGNIVVQSGTDLKWVIHSETTTPQTPAGCKLKSNASSPYDLEKCEKHLIIETPTESGGSYLQYPDKPLTIKDPSGVTCKILNSDLYVFHQDGTKYKDGRGRYFNQSFKFKTNQDLGRSLKKQCPKLDVSMLLNRPVVAKKTSAAPIDSIEEKRARDILEGRGSQ